MTKISTEQANQKYRAYISPINQTSFNAMKDPFVKTDTFKTQFRAELKKALNEYGLLERLKSVQSHKASAPDSKDSGTFRALNLVCGEGMYLHLFSELLEAEKAAGDCELYGIDANPALISVASDFCQLSKPPRPFLRFYLHDLQKPLEKSEGLTIETRKELKFDFIFGLNTMIYTPGAKEVLARLYQENLKPGGVMYLRDYVASEGADGWISPHPALHSILSASYRLLDSYNPGVNVAYAVSGWLAELGAEQLQATQDIIPWGGTSLRGRSMMRDIISLAHLGSTSFIQTGLMTQAEYDNLMQVVYHDLTMEALGQVIHIDTLARKPS